MRDEIEHVQARHALGSEQRSGVGLRLLQDGRHEISGLGLRAARALHVQHGGLQHAAKRERLGRATARLALAALDAVCQEAHHLRSHLGDIGTCAGEHVLAVGIAGQGIE